MLGKHHNVCDMDAPLVCSGCGVCAGICPVNVLEMQFNQNGEYVPFEVNENCIDCGICVKSCPFTDISGKLNETQLAESQFKSLANIQFNPTAGYYDQCYAGFSNVDDHRANGSSGGLATWLTETMLKKNLIDAVAVVVPNDGDSEKLFKFTMIDRAEEVRSASKSCYYPVELSQIIQKILREDRRYAVVGIPCFIKGLQLARRQNPLLDQRIVFTVGLVCGSLQSKRFADYLCAMRGMDPGQLNKVRFRMKTEGRLASNHGTFLQTKQDSTTVFWSEGITHLWDIGYFKPESCSYCDDVFAETADLVFMDAWLPQYKKDYRGTSMVLTRHPAISELFCEGIETHEISLEPVSIEQVVKSQIGGVQIKKKILAHRLYVQQKRGKKFVQKRVLPQKSQYLDQILLFNLRERMRIIGRNAFLNDPTPHGAEVLQKKTQFLRWQYNLIKKTSRSLHRLNRKIKKAVKRG